MLRLLRDGVGDSSRRVLSVRRLPLAFFTFFFSLEAQSMVLGFLSFKVRVHLTYFRSGMEMDLSCESLTSFNLVLGRSTLLRSNLKVFIGSSW